MKSLIQILLIISVGIAAIFLAYFVIIDQPSPEPDAVDDPIVPDSLQEKIIPNEYDIMKQKYDDFLSAYYALVEAQRNVIPYPINYSHVTGEGFTDLEQGIEWCTNVISHTNDIDLLLTELNETLAVLEAIENKTPQIVELIDEKYSVLSALMTKEINNLEYSSYQVGCDIIVEDTFDIESGYTGTITNFQQCVSAGNPVMESYPEQCAAGSQIFERIIK